VSWRSGSHLMNTNELETRLRGHARVLDAEVGKRTGLEERLLARVVATPPAPVKRMPLLREAALAACVALLAVAAGYGVVQIRAAHRGTASKGTDGSLPARLSYTPGTTVTAGPVQIGSSRTGVTMKMFTSLRGWAVGPAAKGIAGARDALLVTADGGSHWRNVTPPMSSGEPNVLIPFFLDANHAWVALASESIPGGPRPVTATFTIFRTDDGGASWRKATPALVEGMPSELDFVGATLGWLVLTTASSDVHLYRTVDGGVHWSMMSRHPLTQVGDSQPAGVLPRVDAISSGQADCGFDSFVGTAFHGASTGWTAGQCSGPVLKPYFYVSHDAGKTWNPEVPPIPSTTKCTCFVSGTAPVFTSPRDGTSVVATSSIQSHCEMQGTSTGCMRRNTAARVFIRDQRWGQSWSLHELPGVAGGTGPTFVAGGTGWYAAATLQPGSAHNETMYGRLYATHDGGASWAPLETSSTFQGGDLNFINPTTGWALNGSAPGLQTFLETKDGGRSWHQLNPVVTG